MHVIKLAEQQMFVVFKSVILSFFCLQELGDVENWAKSIETDMRTISSALEYAYTKSEWIWWICDKQCY